MNLTKTLKRSWRTFFGSFNKLSEIQEKAIPLIIDEKNVLLISETASGKTEAVVAPLVERIQKQHQEDILFVLYIVPTRALVKNIYDRIVDQFRELEISLNMKTGDYPSMRKVPNFLITTPESLDSLICRRKEIFFDLFAVVLDEIHFLDGTARGDQLRVLLRRLKEITKEKFNTYILSATIAEPVEMGNRYISDEFNVIQTSGKRKIKNSFCNDLDDVYKIALEENLRKILVFCNKRETVEALSKKAKDIWGKPYVVAHHGSLSKPVRTEAEEFMKNSPFGICFSTMTLEVGIDIGNIDAVVLAQIPWTISAFLQRIGRANRRGSIIRVISLVKTDVEKSIISEMLENAKNKNLPETSYNFDLGVIIQQIFSVLFANVRGKIKKYFEILFQNLLNPDTLYLILENLVKLEWIEHRNNKYYASTKIMNLGRYGKIHSNINSSKELPVLDISTKKIVGKILYPIDNIFVLNAKVWKIVQKKENKLYVKHYKSDKFLIKFRRSRNDSLYLYLLPDVLKEL